MSYLIDMHVVHGSSLIVLNLRISSLFHLGKLPKLTTTLAIEVFGILERKWEN